MYPSQVEVRDCLKYRPPGLAVAPMPPWFRAVSQLVSSRNCLGARTGTMKKFLVGVMLLIGLGILLFYPSSGCQQPIGGFPVPCNLFEAIVMGLVF